MAIGWGTTICHTLFADWVYHFDMTEPRRLIGIVFAIAIALTGALALETILSLVFTPATLGRIFTLTADDARFLMNGLSRNSNQLLAIIFTTIAIAVPLTANMYSIKFLELFIKDRVTQIVLGVFILALPHSTWIMLIIKNDYVPIFSLSVSLVLLVLTPTLLITYLYYLFRFLHPNVLLSRLEKEIDFEFEAARRKPTQAAARAHAASQLVEHIASIAIRSVDRSDRSTAIESVFALKRLMKTYWQKKGTMPRAWFIVDSRALRSFSREMVLEISESRRWMEMKILSQMREVLSAAIPRMHDLVNAVSDASSELGAEKDVLSDEALTELFMEYFNTFIRLAINRRDQRAVFTLFNQYRTFAETLCDTRPEILLEIAFYFQYYAQAARDQNMPFVVEAIAHDLGALVRVSWEHNLPKWEKMLERFLLFDRETQEKPLPGVKKAQVILAGFFLLHDLPEQARLIGKSLKGLDPKFIEKIKDDLLHVRREKYWEISERRFHIDYVPPKHREKIAEFFEMLT